MKFVSTSELNDLHAAFQKGCGDGQDFQRFVEESRDHARPVCLDTEELREFLARIHDEDYDYLLECDDKDLEFYGEDYLKRINLFRKLLGGEEEITIEAIKEDRQSLLEGDGNEGNCNR
jgi:DNA-binding Lrp family transcriptional regulator